MKQTAPFIISINRQLGSGGGYIGQQLADKLNIIYADRDIIRSAAKKLSVLEEDIEFRDEMAPTFWQTVFQSTAFIPNANVTQKVMAPTDRELFEAESEVIQHLASEHSAVIIGRCGFHVLQNHPNLVSVFLHSNNAYRIEQIQKQYQVPREVAEKIMLKNDKERVLYCKTFTGKDWYDAKNYNLAIDTSKIELDQAIELILDYLKLKGFI